MNNKKTIIIVDPDINLIEDLQRRFMLEPDFKIIDISTSGADGFAKIQTKKPDFAVIANPLPDADALQIMNSVTRTLPQVLKIASIEVNNDVLASQCMQAGALHVLVKPYTADDLIEVMKRMELKAPVYRAQDQYQNPSQGFGVGRNQIKQKEVHIVN